MEGWVRRSCIKLKFHRLCRNLGLLFPGQFNFLKIYIDFDLGKMIWFHVLVTISKGFSIVLGAHASFLFLHLFLSLPSPHLLLSPSLLWMQATPHFYSDIFAELFYPTGSFFWLQHFSYVLTFPLSHFIQLSSFSQPLSSKDLFDIIYFGGISVL